METTQTLYIGGETYPLRIYTERRNSVRVSLTRKGIIIRVPRHLSSNEREKEVAAMIAWAQKRIQEDPEHRFTKKEYAHGTYIRTHSKIYELHIELRNSTKNFSKIQGNTIVFKIAEKHSKEAQQMYISKQLRKLLAKHHHEELNAHVHYINERYFKKRLASITYKHTVSRWGACKPDTAELSFSTRLLLAPLPVLEYVIIHELAHLIEANHSKRFWNIVKSVDPQYKEKIKWLKKYGHTLEI